jgi:hypothetical protein
MDGAQLAHDFACVAIEQLCSVESCSSEVKCRGWCSKHYLRWRAHGSPTKLIIREKRKDKNALCVVCGNPFIADKRTIRTCGRECALSLRHRTRSDNSRARRLRNCDQCGIQFQEKGRSSKQIREGKKQQFCSNKCRADSQRVYATRRDANRAYHERRRVRKGLPVLQSLGCEVCDTQFKQAVSTQTCCSPSCRVTLNIIRSVDRSPRKCVICGVMFSRNYGQCGPRVICSPKCRRAVKQAYKKAREARERVVTVETVVPLNVFERDKWRCQICGNHTPRKLRGTIDAKAPELDHIIPLAAGGEHSYRNTQCACRACNSAKGAKPLGQQRLFG